VSTLSATCSVHLGRLKCWGRNDSGQLGLGDRDHRGDEPGEMGDALPYVDLGTNVRVDGVATGHDHTCAMVDGSREKCWGRNDFGELGLGDTVPRGGEPGQMGDALPFVELGRDARVTQLALGIHHTCALFVDGRMKCWGRNDHGQLGLGDSEHRGDDSAEMGDALPHVDLGGAEVVRMAVGGWHTCALLSGGDVKCWGANAGGQLGLGHTGNLGDQPGEMGDTLRTVDLGRAERVTDLRAGVGHTCALLTDASVKCWGGNSSGQLGLGDRHPRGRDPGDMGNELPRVDLGGIGVSRLSIGGQTGHHTCALLGTGEIKCWGPNTFGALGSGDACDRGAEPGDMGENLPSVDLGTGAKAIDVSLSRGTSCAVLMDERVKCWGYNAHGEVGVGDTVHRGNEAGSMGDALLALELGFDQREP
jgi:alpha-tubulin suppressor-like RCC1 family protein